jgi:hypothetical protein
MRQTNPLVVPRAAIKVERKLRASCEDYATGLKRADPQFRALKIDKDSYGTAYIALNSADQVVTLFMILVRAVAKVQAKNVSSRIKQTSDNLGTGACRTEGSDDFGVAVTAHFVSRP